MTTQLLPTGALLLALGPQSAMASGAADPRLREVPYDPQAVITVPVKRGVVTLVVLGADETISEVGAGLGGDCTKPEAAWCVAAQPGGRTLFVKPKSSASGANTLAVVTDRRVHNLQFVVLAEGDARAPVYRLTVKAPAPPGAAARPTARTGAQLPVLPVVPLPPPPEQVVAERLQARPRILNSQYSLAEGRGSEGIVPTVVFDDGRFTYLRLPGNREVPAVFDVLGDGTETLVNTRMEDDLLVVDRVSRRFVLRAGPAVVGLWNEAFDPEGAATDQSTTVPGVARVLKPAHADAASAANGATP